MRTIDHKTAQRLNHLKYNGNGGRIIWVDKDGKEWTDCPCEAIHILSNPNYDREKGMYDAPYLEQVVDWLRNEYNIYIWTQPTIVGNNPNLCFTALVYQNNGSNYKEISEPITSDDKDEALGAMIRLVIKAIDTDYHRNFNL